MLPTTEQIRQFLTGVVLPPLVGALVTYLFANTHILNLFNISEASAAGELTQLGAWAITTAIAWLTTHHILMGHYAGTNK